MLQVIVDFCFYNLFSLDSSSKIVQSLNFFVYDVIKILGLLFFMIAIIGFIRTYVSQEKIRDWLASKHKLVGHFAASIFGAITPFCSCSSIPLFLSFLKAGVPLGITFSFIITSPIINEYLVVLMFGFFGFKITIFYVVFGILIGVVSGVVLGALKLEGLLEKDLMGSDYEYREVKYTDLGSRLKYGVNEAVDIIKKLWKWIVVAVAIGALVHNYVPEVFIQGMISKGGIFTVPLAVLLGVPIYGSCAAILPIAVVLFNKGIPLGTALAFMMSVSALSLPEAIILRRAMKLKLIGIFFGIVALAMIVTGYLFNVLQGVL